MASLSLQIKAYTFHFPSGYEFKLKAPQEITVYQITQIMKSYQALHRSYGLKHESQQLSPICLASLDRNIIEDIFLSSDQCWDDDLSSLINSNFRIFYGTPVQINRKESARQSPTQKYQILGKVQYFEERQRGVGLIIGRCRSTGKMVSIKSIQKQHLTFNQMQNLIREVQYCQRVNTECTKNFQQIVQIFETKNTVCIVNKLMPFNLMKVKIQNKYLMDLIINQIAKLLHSIIRDVPDILPNQINLSHFVMDFQFQLFYTGRYQGDRIPYQVLRGSFDQKFNLELTYLVQELLKNSTLKVIQYYIPLIHWLKNKRIKTYLDFIKLFQVEGPSNLENCIKEKQKKKIINCWLRQYYIWPKLCPLNQAESLEFFQSYIPKTSIFTIKQKIIDMGRKEDQNKKMCQYRSIENISTVKKRKQSIKCGKELHQVGQILKSKRFNQAKTKSKKKKCQFSAKVVKAKSHKRVISQFLIDD